MSFSINELFSVAGKTAVVTGGSRGIGKMIAEGFVANGVKTYITARKADACQATAEELSASGGTCIAIPADLASDEGRSAFVAELKKREESLDILVNNAGAAWGAKNLAFRLAPKGLTVNAIAPGPFESKMMEATLAAHQERIENGNPLGRIGNPQDMAGLALYLSSAASKYLNGQIIALDGGSHLGTR